MIPRLTTLDGEDTSPARIVSGLKVRIGLPPGWPRDRARVRGLIPRQSWVSCADPTDKEPSLVLVASLEWGPRPGHPMLHRLIRFSLGTIDPDPDSVRPTERSVLDRDELRWITAFFAGVPLGSIWYADDPRQEGQRRGFRHYFVFCSNEWEPVIFATAEDRTAPESWGWLTADDPHVSSGVPERP